MNYKKILLIRTDRIGDVLLSTPAIEAVRKKFPLAHIAVMVTPYAKDIISGNPYVDELIIYDKASLHASIAATYLFARKQAVKNFDVALIFHPTNRAHLIPYLAGIPQRIGYDRNMGFLLTKRIPHTKQLGQMHEIDYIFQMLALLGIKDVKPNQPFMPITIQSENAINSLFNANDIDKTDKVAVFHPGASCNSKVWPTDRFAKLADRLMQEHNIKSIIVSGNDKRNLSIANKMKNLVSGEAVLFAGKLSVSELASCIKRADVFISNDSGPVHIGCALGVPSVVIFGRAQPGLSPRRWGPVGKRSVVLHKNVGCGQNCLAHNCQKAFACLNAVTVEEAYEAITELLN